MLRLPTSPQSSLLSKASQLPQEVIDSYGDRWPVPSLCRSALKKRLVRQMMACAPHLNFSGAAVRDCRTMHLLVWAILRGNSVLIEA